MSNANGAPIAAMGAEKALCMERWAVRRRLRHMHRWLVDSRVSLEQASATVGNKWLNNMLYMLSCRRLIMVHLLDRELGTLGIPVRPAGDGDQRFSQLFSELQGKRVPLAENGVMNMCEQDTTYLRSELHDLLVAPGLSSRTQETISAMLTEVEADMNDLSFAKLSLP